MQGELGLVGSATRPRYRHPLSEIRLCTKVTHAVRLSLSHAQMDQETLAERIGVSPSYMSLLLNGKRPWQQRQLQMIRTVTGSLATLQFAAMQEGVELYVDDVEVRKAQLRSELAQLERAA